MMMTTTPSKRAARAMTRALLCAALALGALSCSKAESRKPMSRAQRIVSPDQIVGGPASRSEIGDYMMENEHVRVVVQDLTYNRGAGLFGGSLIDADLKRPGERADQLGVKGRDSFGELFPAFFLEVVDPERITILNDGSDGKAAVIEVSGRGGEFVTLLRLFNQIMVNSYNASENLPRALRGRPPLLDQEPQVEFSARYILEPDARHVRVESTLRNISLKTLEFPNRGILTSLRGVLGVDLTNFVVPVGAVLGLGKLNSPFLPGIGYDIQFGLLESATSRPVELPGLPGHLTPIVASSSATGVNYGFAMGFSPTQEAPEQIAAREHFVYAKDQQQDSQGRPFYQGQAAPDDMLFLFYASGFGGVFTHQIPTQLAPSFCDEGPNADAQRDCDARFNAERCSADNDPRGLCERLRTQCITEHPNCVRDRQQGIPAQFTYTNYLFIGDGDVSSLFDEYYRVRGVKTQVVQGRLLDEATGQPTGPGESIVLYKARPEAQQRCVEDKASGQRPYIFNQITTKAGGFFELTLPAGHYCYRTQSRGRPLGGYVPFEVKPGQDLFIEPITRAAAFVRARVVDAAGRPLPAKVTVVGTHEFAGQGLSPKDFLFELPPGEPWRTTDFIPDVADDPETRQYIEEIDYTDASGEVTLRVRPGTYRVYFSRGPEYELDMREVEAKPGVVTPAQGRLVRSVDTTGYVSADLHVHAMGSIDSGLDFTSRVLSLAAEGVEIAAATDHNYVADYSPFILAQNLEPYLRSIMGLELTTFEAGHFNGFPVRYDVQSSTRGSFEWQDQPPGVVFEELRQLGTLGPDDTIIQVNHPRDSVLGYFSQHNVDSFDTSVDLPFNVATGTDRIFAAIAAANGPAFYTIKDDQFETTFSWNFDAIEVFNGKRFELLRHYRATRDTLRPVYLKFYQDQELQKAGGYNADTCQSARDQVATCGASDETACQTARMRVEDCGAKEQAALTLASPQADAHLARLGDRPVIVCDGDEVAHPGHLDDWYNLLNHDRPYTVLDYEQEIIQDPARLARYRDTKYKKYTATGNSDTHQARTTDEPGYPRNLIWVGKDDPAQVTDLEVVRGIQAHHVIVTNGPFINMRVNGRPVGSQLDSADGQLTIELEAHAPSWIQLDRFRLMANGEVLREGPVTLQGGVWRQTLELTVSQDTWFVLEVEGDKSLFPVLAPNEIPPLDIEAALGSLAGPFGFGGAGEGLEPELTAAMTPFAFTNPIWVVRDGDGVFSPPNAPVGSCKSGLYDSSPTGALDPRRLGDRRLDAIKPPFKLHHPNLAARLKGERRDVRLIFEAFGHSH